MSYSFRRRAIHIAREAYWLFSRRGIVTDGFVSTQDGYTVWVTVSKPGLGTEKWIVYLSNQGKLQGANRDTD